MTRAIIILAFIGIAAVATAQFVTVSELTLSDSQKQTQIIPVDIRVPKSAAAIANPACEPLKGCQNCESTLAISLCIRDCMDMEMRPNGPPGVTLAGCQQAEFHHRFTP